MPTNVKPTFLDQLRSSGLLEPEQLKELAELPESKQTDPRPLARQVFQRGWLTRHQINQVVAGRAKELFVGPYVLVDRLGEGGMGMVFKARHRHMGRVVALKIIRKEKLANPDAVDRFYREVRAAAQLSHPNIVLAFDAGQEGSTHFLSMEFVDGTDLARLVRESGPLPVAQACEYVRQAALGLQHAHERGLVHRDIKPHNLLLTRASGLGAPAPAGPREAAAPGDLVKILDMGLALRGGSEKDRVITQTGAVIGTPDYIAPEQAINSRSADIRADLYSLGCTLYFLLTGRAPFLGESLTQVLLQHQMEEAAPLEQLRADTPPALAAVVKKLMAKRPEDRFQTPAELAQVLEALAQGETYAIQTTPASPPAVLPARTEPAVDSFWNTIVEGGDAPAGTPAPARCPPATAGRVAEHTDRTEAGERVVKGRRGQRTVAKEKTKSKGGLTRQQKIGLAVGGGVFAFLLLLVVVVALVSGGGKKDDNTDRDDRVTKQGPDDKKGPDKGPGPAKQPTPGTERRLFAGHADKVNAVAFSPDGALALSGGEDKTLRLWDVATGKELHRINDFKDAIKSVTFAPDGKRFFASTGEKGLREWYLATREEIGTPRYGLLLSPYGSYGATLGEVEQKPSVRVWNLTTGRNRLNVPFPVTGGEVRVAFSAGDRRVVLLGAEGTLAFCELQNGQGRKMKIADGPSRCVAVSPDGSVAVVVPEAAGRAAPPARVWSLAEERALRVLEDRGQGVLTALAFAPDSRHLVSGGADGVVRVWDAGTGLQLAQNPGHAGPVHSVAVAASGRQALSAGEDGSVRLWDVTTLLPVDGGPGQPPVPVVQGGDKPLRVLRGHSRLVTRTLFLPDGQLLSIALDGILRVWDVASGREDHAISGRGGEARTALVPGGHELLMVDSFNKHVRRIDLKRGKQVRVYTENTVHVASIAVAQDGKQFATAGGAGGKDAPAGDDHHVRLWDLETGKLANTLKGHTRQVHRVAFTTDGKRVVSVADSVRVWDRVTGELLRRYPETGFAGAMAISDDGCLVLVGGRGGLRLYNTETGELGRPLPRPAKRLAGAVVVGKSERILFWGFADSNEPAGPPKPRDIPGVLWLCDARSGEVLRRFEGHTGGVRSVSVSPDGRLAASGSTDNTVCVWDLEGQGLPAMPDKPSVPEEIGKAREAKLFKGHEKEVDSVAISRDGRRILSGGRDETARLWDATTGKELKRLPHPKQVHRVALSPDGRLMATAAFDSKVRIWDGLTGLPRGSLPLPRQQVVHDLVFSPDSHSLLTSSMAGSFSLWSLAIGREVVRFEGHTDSVECVAFSRDGRFVVSGSKDRTIRIWDARTGKARRKPFEGHTDRVTTVAFGLDGKQVFSASFDGTLRTWDVVTGKEVGNVNTGLRFILRGVFDSEGSRALLVSPDPSVRLWDLKAGKEVCRLEGHTSPVVALAFSADGKRALTAGDFTVRLWDLPKAGP